MASKFILKNGNIINEDFSLQKADIEVTNGIITDIGNDLSCDSIIDVSEKILSPGLIDRHTHGCIGLDATETSDISVIDRMSLYYAQNGITSFLPTLECSSVEKTALAVKNIRNAIDAGISGANIPGIHLEGPYINVKYKGAQDENCIRKPDSDEIENLNNISGGLIKLITVAPEVEGAIDFIRNNYSKVAISIGHTEADYNTTQKALIAGASSLTHTFNAMPGVHHRKPGPIVAAYENGAFCEFICDGFHIDKSVILMMYKLLGDDKMLFISDSLNACGMKDGRYFLGSKEVFVVDGKAKLSDGTIAGSTTNLFGCVKKAVEFGISPLSAIKMASITPARSLGIDGICGSITIGKRADILVLDKKYCLDDVYVGGKHIES